MDFTLLRARLRWAVRSALPGRTAGERRGKGRPSHITWALTGPAQEFGWYFRFGGDAWRALRLRKWSAGGERVARLFHVSSYVNRGSLLRTEKSLNRRRVLGTCRWVSAQCMKPPGKQRGREGERPLFASADARCRQSLGNQPIPVSSL